MRFLSPLFICCWMLLAGRLPAQDSIQVPVPDTLVQAVPLQPDTEFPAASAVKKEPADFSSSDYLKVLQSHPYYNFGGKGVFRTIIVKTERGKDGLFYLLAGLLFLLALIKLSFGRYLENMFKVFFRASLKAKQIREQLLQTPLASLLLNIHFVAASGLLAAMVLHQYQTNPADPGFWKLYLYSILAVALVYTGKNFILQFLGWSLRMKDTTDTYIFIVFLCNKVLGIFLLPLLMLIAFANEPLVTVATTLSYVLVVAIFLYRYISAYGFITRELKASRFHFFLYLCAFEVAPLLLIYKVLTKIV